MVESGTILIVIEVFVGLPRSSSPLKVTDDAARRAGGVKAGPASKIKAMKQKNFPGDFIIHSLFA